ncbi:hypothetical protein TNCV_633881 [Trichonephila clavipes]|nr:hypothetical protein TNCV_633881 [Trichonephila clavipes]
MIQPSPEDFRPSSLSLPCHPGIGGLNDDQIECWRWKGLLDGERLRRWVSWFFGGMGEAVTKTSFEDDYVIDMKPFTDAAENVKECILNASNLVLETKNQTISEKTLFHIPSLDRKQLGEILHQTHTDEEVVDVSFYLIPGSDDHLSGFSRATSLKKKKGLNWTL